MNELEIRIQKAEQLNNAGHNPYHPERFARSKYIEEVLDEYAGVQGTESTDKVVIAGRVVSVRDMGKAMFFDIKDMTGKIQIYAKEESVGDKYNLLKNIDSGDWIGIAGNPMRTRRGELSINASNCRFLTKSIRPLPLGKETENEKFSTATDPELLYRQPEIRMAVDDLYLKTLIMRNEIIKNVRELLWSKRFEETDIPILEMIYGGANARPFITKANALNTEAYLRISLELPLKRLIVGGFDGVFHIGHVFRNEGIDRNHNPEFTLLEVYKSLWDYNDVMKLTEEIYTESAKKINQNLQIRYGKNSIDLETPWKRITMKDAIKEYSGIDVDSLDDIQLKAVAARQNKDTLENAGISIQLKDDELVKEVERYNSSSSSEIPINQPRGLIISYLFEELAQSKLLNPTFVIDHPKETSPLCKQHRSNPELIERFELFINGWECANAYSELNDPVLQRKLLEEQANQLRAGTEEAMPMDENFVRAIEYGMPTTGGLGIGIDRMVMLLTAKHWPEDNPPTIRDIIYFPLAKQK